MKRLVFTPLAQADINDIWDYSVKQWSFAQTERYIKAIRDSCQMLVSGQKRGRAVDVRNGYLKYLVGQNMVYFIEHDDTLEVVRILHVKRDVQQHLSP